MATPITDPGTLALLNAPPAPRKPISDPDTIGQLEYAIDFKRPVAEVREAIAKLPDNKRQSALRHWADSFVARENAQGQAMSNVGRTIARGTFVGPWLDELNAATNAGLHKVSGGLVGAPYDESLAYQHARDRAVDTAYPVLSTGAQIATGLVTGGVAMKAGAGAIPSAIAGPVNALTPAASVGGRVAQGAVMGGVYGANAGAGNASGGIADRAEGAAKGGFLGAALGGIVSSGVETVRGINQARAGVGTQGGYKAFVDTLPEGGVDNLANKVATGSTSLNAQNQRRVLDIVGEEMSRANGDKLAARDAAIQRLMQEQGISAATARDQIRKLAATHRDSALMLSEYPAVAESNRALAKPRAGNIDIQEASQITNTQTQGLVDYLANTGGKADAMTRTAVADRQAGMIPWMRERLQAIAPGLDLAKAEAKITQAEKLAGADYKAAHAAPLNRTDLQAGLEAAINNAKQRLGGRAGDYEDALNKALREFEQAVPASSGQPVASKILGPSGQPIMTPGKVVSPVREKLVDNLQAAQDARAAVRGQMDAAWQGGRKDVYRVLKPFYDDVTQAMSKVSPQWRAANDRWGDANLQEKALELGQRFTDKAGLRQRETVAEFKKMAPEAQDMVRTGWIQKQLDKLDGIRDTNDVSKMFDKQEIYTAVKVLFGDKPAVELAKAVRDAEVASLTAAGTRNSATNRRMEVQKTLDSDLHIVAAAQHGAINAARNWIVQKLSNLMREGRNRSLSEIVTTPMNDVFTVAKHLHQAGRAEARTQRMSQPTMGGIRGAGAAGQTFGGMVAP